jgi:AcrR family transcriptional regulator
MTTRGRQRELDQVSHHLRKFRKLPKNQQQQQINRLLAEQHHLNNTVYKRRTRQNEKMRNFPISGSREYLKTGRGILFPVGVTSNGSLIWKTEDVDFLGEWLHQKKTNPWTRETVGEPTLPEYIYKAVMRKTHKPNHIQHTNTNMSNTNMSNTNMSNTNMSNTNMSNTNTNNNIPHHNVNISNINIHTHLSPQETELFQAIRHGNVERVRTLLDQGVSPNFTITYDHSALTPHQIRGIHRRHPRSLASLMIRHYYHNKYPIHIAAAEGDLEILQALVEHGADVNTRDDKSRTPLHYCDDNYEIYLALLQLGANPNSKDREGWTPLHNVIEHDSLSPDNARIVSALLRHGADPNAQTNNLRTPLHIWAREWPFMMYMNAIDIRAERQETRGFFSTMFSRRSTQLRTLNLLRDARVDFNKQDAEGRTVLHILGYIWSHPPYRWLEERFDRSMQRRVFDYIVHLGADPSIPDHHGVRPRRP